MTPAFGNPLDDPVSENLPMAEASSLMTPTTWPLSPSFGSPLDDASTDNLPKSEPSPMTTKGKRGREFTIHVDDDCCEPALKKATASENNIPKTKGSKKSAAKKKSVPKKIHVYKTKSGRTILGDLSSSGNSSPTPSPRLPTTPFTLSPFDLDWENLENYESQTAPAVSTPATSFDQATPSPSPRFETLLTSEPATPVVHRRTRFQPPRPCNLVLYHELDVPYWATKTAIKAAFKRLTLLFHPDKHQGNKMTEEYATKLTERLLAAREILMDNVLRAKYDADGILPEGWPFGA
jgi:hypothetical protein